ncbi:hypothetical protein VN12_00885 [Pirellula sp. SH-Sr6A]|uniref:PEP-CTERM sorting domain-containing protein n=1 Tax=Pirellula sp. SH-Sr6A TaxID=1632865 RepID=UPI00078BF266|nr:PEP-CTERM sorting domain-containing protein [Pirellula sp. SH-Sr6A]AMV30638.1 hypothetical protein VN12_00885 [Pirellula sp. SH-Sr6A]
MYRVLVLVACLFSQSVCHAGFFFQVENVNLVSDGVNPTVGSANVYLFTDNPAIDIASFPTITGYGVSLQPTSFSGLSAAQVQLTSATFSSAPFAPLFPSAPTVTANEVGGLERMTVTTNFGDLALNPSVVNNAGLFKVNFSVAAGATGSFSINPINSAGPPSFESLMFGATGSVNPGLTGGTVTISAVPEPGSMLLLAVSGSLVGIVARRRFKAVRS